MVIVTANVFPLHQWNSQMYSTINCPHTPAVVTPVIPLPPISLSSELQPSEQPVFDMHHSHTWHLIGMSRWVYSHRSRFPYGFSGMTDVWNSSANQWSCSEEHPWCRYVQSEFSWILSLLRAVTGTHHVFRFCEACTAVSKMRSEQMVWRSCFEVLEEGNGAFYSQDFFSGFIGEMF